MFSLLTRLDIEGAPCVVLSSGRFLLWYASLDGLSQIFLQQA